MILKKKIRAAAIGVVALILVAGATTMANAVPQDNLSDGPVHLYQSGMLKDASTSFGWTAAVYGSTSDTDINGLFNCPTDSTGVYTFMTDPGGERTPSTWKAFAPNAFSPGTTNVLTPNFKPSSLINGVPGQGSMKASGGTFSLGFACTTNNGLTVGAAYYRTVTVTPVTGAYTAAAVSPTGIPPVVPPVVPGPQNGTVALAPTTTGAVNGVLALTVPAGAAASFNAPTLVNNKSTTTGTLGNITVNDGRVLTREGWNLSATVADFKNSIDTTNIISKSQLGVAPKLVVAGTSATGVTAAAAQVPGAAIGTYAFASGAAANTVGDSVLNADLTFVAPPEKAAGTYNSTMTLTVVSK